MELEGGAATGNFTPKYSFYNSIDMPEAGIISKVSQLNFQETYDKLKHVISDNPNLKLILELDHQANAASVDLTLPPTRAIFFGNPRLGTHLMASGEFAALDLPQKIVVTEREGTITVAYNDPAYLKARHDIEGQDEVIQKIAGALDKITSVATQA
ncbi:MAG: DUF302 domain-containing protein [Cytophagales bacterium]|nr:DUF302 domain-containing protein [Cytophagales bacterium]